MTTASLPATLTADEIAALTGLARASVYAGLESGALPGTRIGKRWIVSRIRIQERLGFNDEQVAATLEAVRQRKACLA
jgi:excisionase family DNA binding protein